MFDENDVDDFVQRWDELTVLVESLKIEAAKGFKKKKLSALVKLRRGLRMISKETRLLARDTVSFSKSIKSENREKKLARQAQPK